MLYKAADIEVPEEEPFRHDKLDREVIAHNLTGLVRSVEGPFVFAINSAWGGGKTTFIRMWEAILKSDGQETIYFNAWSSDFSEEPLLAFMAAFDRQLPDGRIKHAKEKAVQLGASFLRRALPYAVQVGTGGLLGSEQLEAAFKFSEKTQEQIQAWAAEVARERLAAFNAEQDAVAEFKKSLGEISREVQEDTAHVGPLVVFVDELDRCRPDFAVALLERIKHLFDIPGIVFILAVDLEQLGHSVRALYGDGIKADEYLRRFIDLVFTLPPPNLEAFVETLLTRDELGSVLKGSSLTVFVQGFPELARAFGFSLRTTEQVFAEISLTLRMSPGKAQRELGPLIATLHVLKVKQPILVRKFLSGEAGAVDVIKALDEVAPAFRETSFGVWAEAQLRASSLVEDELGPWVSSVDTALRAGKASKQENRVREALKTVRHGSAFYSSGSPVPVLARIFHLTTQFSFPHPGTSEEDEDGPPN